jgi:signal transduction histidine kinase
VSGVGVSGIEAGPDGHLCLGPDRRIRAANDAAARLLRRPIDHLLGATLAELGGRDEDGAAVWATGWGAAARLRGVRGVPERVVSFTTPDDSEVTLAATAAFQRDELGRVCSAVVALRDRGRRRRHRGAAAIEIISTVSHELRSPLTSIKGYTSLLVNRWDRLDDAQKRMMLDQVHHDADRVSRLISELLDISRLESGRLGLRQHRVSIPTVAASVLDKVGLEYPTLQASTQWPEDLPPVWADPDKVEQVLTNLVENACKYASPEGLELCAGRTGRLVWVSVTDRGEGIPPADLPKVFSKFFRRSDGRPSGSGLGLWISRGLVEAHGGTLTATSRAGEGSTFRFTLPVAEAEETRPVTPTP